MSTHGFFFRKLEVEATLYLFEHYAIKTYWIVKVQLHAVQFLLSCLIDDWRRAVASSVYIGSNSTSEQVRSTVVPLVYTTRHQSWVWFRMLVSDQIDALAALPLGEEPLYSLHRRMGGRQSRSGRCGGGVNLSIDWESNSDSIVVHLVALLLYLSGCLECSTLYEGW